MIDLACSHRHYLEHLLPVWRALPEAERGTIYLDRPLMGHIPGSVPFDTLGPGGIPVLVAGFDDLRNIGGRPVILMEHGTGQSYGGSSDSARHPAYAGGDGRHGVCGFLEPNQQAADRDFERYPDAYVAVIGSPRLAALQAIPAPPPPDDVPTVCVSFHWDCTISNESRSAWGHWSLGIEALAKNTDYKIIGHAHPRMFKLLVPILREWGIEPVEDFQEVLRRAHVYCCDNSSSMFDFAALRGPSVVLDAPWYRPSIEHGLRFWDCAGIGPRILDRAALPGAIDSALAKQPWPGAEEIIAKVFPPIPNPAEHAAACALEAAKRANLVAPRSAGGFPRHA